MKQQKILFRVSGGVSPKTQLGMGHIFRCINLADNLQNFKINFLLEDYGKSSKIFQQRGFTKLFYLKPKISIKDDIESTKRLILKEKIDLLIIDKYQVSINYVKIISKYVKTIVISDLERIDFPSDLVINGFIGFKNQKKFNKYGKKCLVGPSFQILNKSFTQNIKRKKEFDLLATFGGYDENNLTEKIIDVLPKYLDSIQVKIILGPATKHSKKIKVLAKKFSTSLEIIPQTKDLRNYIAKSNFGICSGGITSYEFARLGVPFAIICQHKHQLNTANEWEKLELAVNLGFPNLTTTKKIEKYIQKIVENQICLKKNTKIIDGKGSYRISKEIKKLLSLKITKNFI